MLPELLDLRRTDPYDWFRYALSLVVGIYVIFTTWSWAAGWVEYLSAGDRATLFLRRYLVVHALRARAARFAGDLLICGLLLLAWGILWWLQALVLRGML